MKILGQIDELIQALPDNMERLEVDKYTLILENAKTIIENLDGEVRYYQRMA